MDPTLARYPFLEAARSAVTERGSSLEEVLGSSGRSAALDRALERIHRALSGDTVGQPRTDHEVELLSYPLARIVVSLVDDPRVTDRYVRAEARSATERLDEEDADGLDRDELLDEFDLDIRQTEAGQAVAVLDYLTLAVDLDDSRWQLVNRQLRDGWVPVGDDELRHLLEAAIRQRVGRDLPLTVPDEVAERLDEAVDEVQRAIGAVHLPAEVPVIDPAAFPPCMVNLVERVEAEEALPPTSRYALAAFLTSLDLAPEELNRVIEEPIPEALTEMAAAVGGDEGPTQFPPGTCETMVAYGDCVNPDELCATIEHPLEYYVERLDES